MQTIRLLMKVNSENIYVPELKEFIGKMVEMTITEATSDLLNEKKNEKMKHFFEAAGNVEIDEESILRLREESKL